MKIVGRTMAKANVAQMCSVWRRAQETPRLLFLIQLLDDVEKLGEFIIQIENQNLI